MEIVDVDYAEKSKELIKKRIDNVDSNIAHALDTPKAVSETSHIASDVVIANNTNNTAEVNNVVNTGVEKKIENVKNDFVPPVNIEIKEHKENVPGKLIGKISDQNICQNTKLMNSVIGVENLIINGINAIPNLINWIEDYKRSINSQKGSLASRMSYLNNTQNARKLSIANKELLSLILKSNDEGIILEYAIKNNNSLDVFLPKRQVSLDDMAKVDAYSLERESKSGVNIEVSLKVEIDRIVALTNIKFENEVLYERFRKAILTRVKGIRDKLQTKEILEKQVNAGGLGMDNESAIRTISIIEDYLDKKNKNTAKVDNENPKVKINVTSNPNNSVIEVTKSNSVINAQQQVPINNIAAPTGMALPQGPIGELKTLTLDNFRRLGATTADRLNKIKEKIAIFESESLSKKAEGIMAWKQSEVYGLYQSMGQESLLSGSKIFEIIENRKKKGEMHLSQEEFDVISEFNKSLRF